MLLLSGRRVLEELYKKLQESPECIKRISFVPPVSRIIWEVAEPYGADQAWMMYESAILLKFHNQDYSWLIAYSRVAYGKYPAESFDSDLLAFKIPDGHDNLEEIRKTVSDTEYFTNTLLQVLRDGNIERPEKTPGYIMKKFTFFGDTILRERLVWGMIGYKMKKDGAIFFKKELTDYLADLIRDGLKDYEENKQEQ